MPTYGEIMRVAESFGNTGELHNSSFDELYIKRLNMTNRYNWNAERLICDGASARMPLPPLMLIDDDNVLEYINGTASLTSVYDPISDSVKDALDIIGSPDYDPESANPPWAPQVSMSVSFDVGIFENTIEYDLDTFQYRDVIATAIYAPGVVLYSTDIPTDNYERNRTFIITPKFVKYPYDIDSYTSEDWASEEGKFVIELWMQDGNTQEDVELYYRNYVWDIPAEGEVSYSIETDAPTGMVDIRVSNAEYVYSTNVILDPFLSSTLNRFTYSSSLDPEEILPLTIDNAGLYISQGVPSDILSLEDPYVFVPAPAPIRVSQGAYISNLNTSVSDWMGGQIGWMIGTISGIGRNIDFTSLL